MQNPFRSPLTLAFIIATYLLIGILYATLTPLWQVPDEPAHYNYIRQLAEGQLPQIEPGDYNQLYQEKLISLNFPAEYSTETIEYQDHQPPLYYLFQVPIFLLFDGAVIPLRIFSLLLGAGVVLFAYWIGQSIYPNRPFVTFTAIMLIAFTPQHIAMMAGVNNDSLAELLVAAALWASIQIISATRPRYPGLIGLLLAAIFFTKLQAYLAAAVLAVSILIRWRKIKSEKWLLHWLLGVFGPAVLIGSFWWLRNIAVYGALDWMGLARHDQVVLGQPTTASWIASYGLGPTLERFLQFTFQSFWGMFGWMGVVMSQWAYHGLLVLTLAAGIGFVSALLGNCKKIGTCIAAKNPEILILTLSALFTAAGYLWWNLSFVQHQGRYLFPALIPIGLAAGVGLEHLNRPQAARLTAAALLLGVLGSLLLGHVALALFFLLAAVVLWLNSLRSLRVQWLFPVAMGAGLALLSIASLFLFILPTLG